MQIVLAPTSPLPKQFLNEFAIISGPGLETVGWGGATAPICHPPPVATPMVKGDRGGRVGKILL